MIINYKYVNVLYENNEEPVFYKRHIIHMIKEYNFKIYKKLSSSNCFKISGKNFTIKDLKYIFQKCDTSFNNFIMKTSIKAIKYHMTPEQLGMMVNIIDNGSFIQNKVPIYNDIFKIIMCYVYDSELEDEIYSIKCKLFDNISFTSFIYIHSLLDINDMIKLISNSYKYAIAQCTDLCFCLKSVHCDKLYEITIVYEKICKTKTVYTIIYSEVYYPLKTRDPSYYINKNCYKNYKYEIKKNKYIILTKVNKIPNIYYKSNIRTDYHNCTITIS